MALSDLTASAVVEAIEEFDRLGRNAFLEKYGYGRARDYWLVSDSRYYDSKAVAGAAHGYLPGRAPLTHDEFSGGKVTVQTTLENLGFKIIGPGQNTPPLPEEVLTNKEISDRFAVGNMGGMRRSKKGGLLVLISDPFKGLYHDRWEGDVCHYTGMGKKGDQSINFSQNRTLAESSDTRIPVHLFEALEHQRYTYVGEVFLSDVPYQEEQVDVEGRARQVWVFPLKVMEGGIIPEPTVEQARAIENIQSRKARRLPTPELRVRAELGTRKPARRETQSSTYVRNPAVAEYVKRVANGICDLCREPAPFRNKEGIAYLECHHIVWLSKRGEDAIGNTVALCPNCHRKMHVLNRSMDQKKLKALAAERAKS